jgi:lipopolysaccharide export system permease protein
MALAPAVARHGGPPLWSTILNTVRRLVHGEILRAVLFVTLAFVCLFVFFDLVEEMQVTQRYGQSGYAVQHALLVVALRIPTHVYQLLPISLLIGSIYVMARLAQNSEFTVLRTGGLGPWRALHMLLMLGLPFVIATFFLGDYLSPLAEKNSQLLKARYLGQISSGQTGAWLKEKVDDSYRIVNVRGLDKEAQMQDIRIQAFNAAGQLQSITQAEAGSFRTDHWQLSNVQTLRLVYENNNAWQAGHETTARLDWPTGITADMVSAALVRPDRMKTWDLFQYINHLSANAQSAQRYEIELWRKLIYPVSCLVMLTLALPFAYLHFRSGQIAGHVFAGVLAGISFHLLNNLFGHVGNLQNWSPMLTSLTPSLLYSMVALATFWWLVLRR